MAQADLLILPKRDKRVAPLKLETSPFAILEHPRES